MLNAEQTSNYQNALKLVVSGQNLSEEMSFRIMEEVMSGKVPTNILCALLVALKMKGEQEEEIAGLVRCMRHQAKKNLSCNLDLEVDQDELVDTCGTGGDHAGTFNISTAAGLVTAACGAKVAKHGNRAVSGKVGSADVLEALGVNISKGPTVSLRSLKEAGFGFFFAPSCHPGMAHAGHARRELGIPTVFNLLGPLSNPLGAGRQLVGVNVKEKMPLLARVLARLGCKKAMIVHGRDGLDEITLTKETDVLEIKNGRITETVFSPDSFGFSSCSLHDLQGGDAQTNASMIKDILAGKPGPCRDIVVVNTAAALLVSDLAQNMNEGIALAQQAIDTGKAAQILERIVCLTNEECSNV